MGPNTQTTQDSSAQPNAPAQNVVPIDQNVSKPAEVTTVTEDQLVNDILGAEEQTQETEEPKQGAKASQGGEQQQEQQTAAPSTFTHNGQNYSVDQIKHYIDSNQHAAKQLQEAQNTIQSFQAHKANFDKIREARVQDIDRELTKNVHLVEYENLYPDMYVKADDQAKLKHQSDKIVAQQRIEELKKEKEQLNSSSSVTPLAVAKQQLLQDSYYAPHLADNQVESTVRDIVTVVKSTTGESEDTIVRELKQIGPALFKILIRTVEVVREANQQNANQNTTTGQTQQAKPAVNPQHNEPAPGTKVLPEYINTAAKRMEVARKSGMTPQERYMFANHYQQWADGRRKARRNAG